jgi:signal transduction histidine kinase
LCARTLPLKSPEGSVTGYVAIIRDITDRKKAEDALRESEAQKRAILDASLDRIRYIDKDMRVIWANKTTALELDMSPEDSVGQACHKLFIGRDTPCEGCPTVRARETGEIERAVMHQPKVKGVEGESYWDNYSVPLKNEAGDIVSFIQVARNITDQKRADEHIHTLTQQLMKAQESERQMISRELHDRVGQDLSTLKIGLDTLIDNQSGVLPETKQRISELSNILRDSVMAIRDLSYDLRPPSLDQLGIIRTIFQYCEDFSEKTGLRVDFTSAGMDDLRLDFDTEINLYRLIQEGLNNIRKHAEANLATIRLVVSSPNIILRIEDDGKGFDVKNRLVTAQNEKRMGLRSMEERARLLKGKMRVQSRLGKGARISIKVPYNKEKSEPKKDHINR